MPDVIICANFGVEKLRGFGYTGGSNIGVSIEMAGHPYNRADAIAQPVITDCVFGFTRMSVITKL